MQRSVSVVNDEALRLGDQFITVPPELARDAVGRAAGDHGVRAGVEGRAQTSRSVSATRLVRARGVGDRSAHPTSDLLRDGWSRVTPVGAARYQLVTALSTRNPPLDTTTVDHVGVNRTGAAATMTGATNGGRRA